MKTKHILWLLPLLLTACHDDPQQLKEKFLGGAAEERVIPVKTLAIDSVCGLVRNSYPGYLEEGQSAEMGFKYGGTLQRLNVKEGSRVRKGQTLASVSSPQLESTQRSAQATLEQAQDAYDRLKKVHDNGSLPDIKWHEMIANLEKARSALDLADAMMADNLIKAPFDGTVSSISAEIGENIAPLRPVIRIINTEGMTVRISVPENEIAKVKLGDTAEIFIPAHADACRDIAPLAEFNIAKVHETASRIVDICGTPASFEQVLKRLFDAFGLAMTWEQHVLVGSTVRSYLSWLKDKGELKAEFKENMLLWYR